MGQQGSSGGGGGRSPRSLARRGGSGVSSGGPGERVVTISSGVVPETAELDQDLVALNEVPVFRPILEASLQSQQWRDVFSANRGSGKSDIKSDPRASYVLARNLQLFLRKWTQKVVMQQRHLLLTARQLDQRTTGTLRGATANAADARKAAMVAPTVHQLRQQVAQAVRGLDTALRITDVLRNALPSDLRPPEFVVPAIAAQVNPAPSSAHAPATRQ